MDQKSTTKRKCPSPRQEISRPRKMARKSLHQELEVTDFTDNTSTTESIPQCPKTSSEFTFDVIMKDEEKFKYYTGLTLSQFTCLWEYLGPSRNKLVYWNSDCEYPDRSPTKRPRPKHKLEPKNELFMTLVRLRHGFLVEDLSYRFNVSTSMVSRIILTWVQILYKRFLPLRSKMFPNAFEGSISDKDIVIKSGFLDHLENGDVIMADRGFVIDDLLMTRGAKLVLPPFLGGRAKLSAQEEASTKDIAKHRIHVERTIERMKKFRILQKTIPLSLEPDRLPIHLDYILALDSLEIPRILLYKLQMKE
ncbi:uncharacterized protein LOC134276384 [Saccostrea cucullata]|uniref:uncharacterized protein LOC134276384 n=1 Tax=Saccostrea cuccullata TaxID=36930 RepID=UPI002ED56395